MSAENECVCGVTGRPSDVTAHRRVCAVLKTRARKAAAKVIRDLGGRRSLHVWAPVTLVVLEQLERGELP